MAPRKSHSGNRQGIAERTALGQLRVASPSLGPAQRDLRPRTCFASGAELTLLISHCPDPALQKPVAGSHRGSTQATTAREAPGLVPQPPQSRHCPFTGRATGCWRCRAREAYEEGEQPSAVGKNMASKCTGKATVPRYWKGDFLLPPHSYTNLRAPSPFAPQEAQCLSLPCSKCSTGAPELSDTQKYWCTANSTGRQPNPAGTYTAGRLSSIPRPQLHGTRGTHGSKGEAGHPQTATAQARLFSPYYYYFKQAALLLPPLFAAFSLQFPQHCPASLSPHRLLPLPCTEARQRKTQHQEGPSPLRISFIAKTHLTSWELLL